jgi:predicted RNA-binding protein Jag
MPFCIFAIQKTIHMKVNIEQAKEIVAKEVSAYLEKYGESTGVPTHILMDPESRSHVISIGTSIMMNSLGFNTYPGSFVQAVLDDKLSTAFAKADSINQKSLRFYVTMMYSLRINISSE